MNSTINNLSLGLGILSWKGGETLKSSLKSHATGNLFSLFKENIIFLPEQQSYETHIAQQYPLSIYGSPKNLGIFGGFNFIAKTLNTDYVLILENDFHLLTNPEITRQTIYKAYELLKNNQADIVRLRSRTNPGEPFCGAFKYQKYYPNANSHFSKKISAWILRQLMPYHTHKSLGMMFYDIEKNIKNYPKFFHFTDNIPITDTRFLPWSNNPCLVKRDFLLENVLKYAENYKTRRFVNGFKNLEIETNSYQWRKNQYKIALPDGIFTHKRTGNRGY
jgi:hypothetical protein